MAIEASSSNMSNSKIIILIVNVLYLNLHMQAWFMDETSGEDQRLPRHCYPKELVSPDYLAELGVLYWRLNPENYENDAELKKIREDRGYNYMDLLDICPEKVADFKEKLKNFYTEHIHADEEIRYCLEGSAYFDVRDKDDRWIRIWIKAGDLIILPAGIYHRFTLDTGDYVKLMRLFVGEPVWTAHNRPQEDHPARKEYIKNLVTEKKVEILMQVKFNISYGFPLAPQSTASLLPYPPLIDKRGFKASGNKQTA
ncbi:12-DIHYDROXY-3-KETO-5-METHYLTHIOPENTENE DIOXYGENASE [Salix purpurea]|uniref:Acireductone dioxygenase n=1 Tax=Salix purpurea TaxID=77065 RepID=A0A9Q0U9S1_SALPP|nr:12-DIHYDROXY-3-KETO-5-METHYLTHIOPENTENE DIOXYGENASE [Salix purpurea]